MPPRSSPLAAAADPTAKTRTGATPSRISAPYPHHAHPPRRRAHSHSAVVDHGPFEVPAPDPPPFSRHSVRGVVMPIPAPRRPSTAPSSMHTSRAKRRPRLRPAKSGSLSSALGEVREEEVEEGVREKEGTGQKEEPVVREKENEKARNGEGDAVLDLLPVFPTDGTARTLKRADWRARWLRLLRLVFLSKTHARAMT